MRRALLFRILGILGVLVVAWLVFFSVDVDYDSSKQLSAHLRLVEHKSNRRSAFTGAGHYAPVILLPVPSSETVTLWQTLLRDDQPVWHSLNGLAGKSRRDAPSFPGDQFLIDAPLLYVSPDERLVVLQSSVSREPIRVLDLMSRSTHDVPQPELARSRPDFGYPLTFHAWSDDSQTLYLRTHEGMDGESALWFREIYAVDP